MVTQTRGMARAAFVQAQSLRHQTRSVVRATAIFQALPRGTPLPLNPPPAPPRSRKRRAEDPVPGEGRPAKCRRTASKPAAPGNATPDAERRSPTPPIADSQSPLHQQDETAPPSPPSANLPPPYQYVPVTPPSPSTIFPARHGASLPNPPANAYQVWRAQTTLRNAREALHSARPKLDRHEPGYQGQPRTPADWELESPDEDQAIYSKLTREQKIAKYREYEMLNDIRRTPKEWLDRRMRRKEDPSDQIQEARRLQTAWDKKNYIDDGGNLKDVVVFDVDEETKLSCPRYVQNTPWISTVLEFEVGWKWRGDCIYQYQKRAD